MARVLKQATSNSLRLLGLLPTFTLPLFLPFSKFLFSFPLLSLMFVRYLKKNRELNQRHIYTDIGESRKCGECEDGRERRSSVSCLPSTQQRLLSRRRFTRRRSVCGPSVLSSSFSSSRSFFATRNVLSSSSSYSHFQATNSIAFSFEN